MSRQGPSGDEWERFLDANAAQHAEHARRINSDHEPRIAVNTSRHDARDQQDAKGRAALLREWFGGVKGIKGWAAVVTLVAVCVLGLHSCKSELVEMTKALAGIERAAGELAGEEAEQTDALRSVERNVEGLVDGHPSTGELDERLGDVPMDGTMDGYPPSDALAYPEEL